MTQAVDPIIVAADGGGTGCRAAAGTLKRGILAEARGGMGNVHSDFDTALANLTGAIRDALAKAGLADTPLDQITAHLGVAGAHSAPEAQTVADALPYGHCTASGDRATSVRGALGDADGYLVALGTGTIIARQDDLHMRTVSGWGFHLSDHASGAWLGRRLLEECLLAEDDLRPHTPLSRAALAESGGRVQVIHFAGTALSGDFGRYAPQVIKAAASGDALGRTLMAEGAAFVAHALKTLGFTPGDMLALSGGVGPHYAAYLPTSLAPQLITPKGSALDGAFAIACAAANGRT